MADISAPTVELLTNGEKVAVGITGVLGTVSALSVTMLLLHIFSVAIVPLLWRSSSNLNYNREERVFLRMHLGVFVVCLLCSDLIQGISGTFQFRWAAEGRVLEGNLCTAQAAMLLFGDNGTAIWTAVVSFHTVFTVVGGKRLSSGVVIALVLCGWTLTGVLTLVGPLAIETTARGPFFGIAGAWCFVTKAYARERILVHYLPMLLSAGMITVNYVLVALVLSGVLVYQNRSWKFVAPYRRQEDSSRRRWFWPKLSFSRLQRSSSSGRGQNSSVRIGSSPNASKEIDGGVGKVPDGKMRRPSTADSGKSAAPQGIEFAVLSDHKVPTPAQSSRNGQVQRVPTLPSSQVQFKTLALKMLWYPIVYIALVLPIATSRIATSIVVDLRVMLAFMCLLWCMGIANVIIYVTTRRLGRSPVLRNRSRSAPRAQRGKSHDEETGGVRSVQIFVDRHTQVEHIITPNTKQGFLEGTTPQRSRIDLTATEVASPTFPAKSFYPPMGANGFEMDGVGKWRRDPSQDGDGGVRIGRLGRTGTAL